MNNIIKISTFRILSKRHMLLFRDGTNYWASVHYLVKSSGGCITSHEFSRVPVNDVIMTQRNTRELKIVESQIHK
jgi:hypothetical protein